MDDDDAKIQQLKKDIFLRRNEAIRKAVDEVRQFMGVVAPPAISRTRDATCAEEKEIVEQLKQENMALKQLQSNNDTLQKSLSEENDAATKISSLLRMKMNEKRRALEKEKEALKTQLGDLQQQVGQAAANATQAQHEENEKYKKQVEERIKELEDELARNKAARSDTDWSAFIEDAHNLKQDMKNRKSLGTRREDKVNFLSAMFSTLTAAA